MSALESLLDATSRTFALSIRLLPPDLRTQVATAYLLFRIADTLEDEARWPVPERVAALERFASMLRGCGTDERRTTAALLAAAPVAHGGYAELLVRSDEVLQQLDALQPAARAAIVRHLCRTVAGMAAFLRRPQGCATVADLRAYCYAVAGIVGELCTELFVAATPALRPVQGPLSHLAVAFGEGLQLVNVLKDEHADSRAGRHYVPAEADRAALFALAADDLRKAAAYVRLLEQHGADRGVVAFNALNLALADASLARIRERGAGAKLTREEVANALAPLGART